MSHMDIMSIGIPSKVKCAVGLPRAAYNFTVPVLRAPRESRTGAHVFHFKVHL